MASRKNAMLTTEDRRWLTGEKTYEGQHAKQQRYQRRNDIRERIYNSILDFAILFDELEEDERQKLFGDVSADGHQWRDVGEQFREGVRDGLAFLLRGVGVGALMSDQSDRGSAPPVAELVLVAALQRAGQREGYLVEDVDLDVEATEAAIPELLEALEAGEDIPPAGVYYLVESGAVDPDALQECLREHVRTTSEGE